MLASPLRKGVKFPSMDTMEIVMQKTSDHAAAYSGTVVIKDIDEEEARNWDEAAARMNPIKGGE